MGVIVAVSSIDVSLRVFVVHTDIVMFENFKFSNVQIFKK